MQNIIKSCLPATASIILSAGILTGCGTKAKTPDAPAQWALTDSLIRKLEVDTASVMQVENQISLTGKITANEDRMARIFPMVSGIVTNVKVNSGDYVQRGQTLAVIKSPEMAGFTADQTISQQDMQMAKRSLEVAESFYKSGLNSRKDYEEAKGNYDKAVATYNKSKAIADINGGAHQTFYTVKATVPGFVVTKKAVENMQWRQDNNDPIFEVADLANVWAIINVFESDISSVHQGDKVQMTTLSYPNKIFEGRIDKIYNVLDPEKKVMKARVVIDNPGYLLKPEMFVSIKAQRHSDSDLVSIRSRGIIFDRDKYYALVLTNQKPGVAIREVKVDHSVEGRAYITSGLQAGDRVIASQQVFIYETLKDQQ